MAKKEKDKDKWAIVKSYVSPDPSSIDILTAKGFVQDILSRIHRCDMGGLSAQLAYFFLLSFFPMLIFLVTLLPYLNLEHGQVFDFIDELMPAEVYSLIEGILVDVLKSQNTGFLSIGILGTIWSASKGVNALMKALNRAYDVEGDVGFKVRLWSLIFTVSLVIVFLVALVLPVFGQQIAHILFSYIGVTEKFESVWNFTRWAMPFTLIIIVVTAMYWIVPNTDPRLKIFSVFPGVFFTLLSWFVVTYGFSFYINNFGNYSATYGSIGGVIILMLWLYFTGVILIFGGLLNATIQRRQLAKMEQKVTRNSPLL